jgi:hypothetical protein
LEKFILEHLTEFMEFSRKYAEEEKTEKDSPAQVFDRALSDIPTQAYLATRVEIGRAIAEVTYALEGDGAMIFVAKDLIMYMMDSLAKYVSGDFELDEETKKRLAYYCATKAAEKEIIKEVASAASEYMNKQFYNKHIDAWTVLCRVSAFCPWNATATSLSQLIEYLKSIKLIELNDSEALLKEVPTFVEIAKDFPKPSIKQLLRKAEKEDGVVRKPFPVEDLVFQFWLEYKNRLPLFSRWFRDFCLIQPTSAGAERVFSLLRHMTISGPCLEDTIAVRTVCHYNSRVAQELINYYSG